MIQRAVTSQLYFGFVKIVAIKFWFLLELMIEGKVDHSQQCLELYRKFTFAYYPSTQTTDSQIVCVGFTVNITKTFLRKIRRQICSSVITKQNHSNTQIIRKYL